MSFDLAFWVASRPISFKEASDHLDRAWAGQIDETDDRVIDFVAALHERWPPIDEVDDADLAQSPWAGAPNFAGDLVYLIMSYPGARRIYNDLKELSSAAGLIMYDPQAGTVLWPPEIQAMDHLRAYDQAGQVIDGPTSEQLHTMVAGLNTSNWFLVLERRSDLYMQTAIDDHGRHAVEYRDGNPDEHYRVEGLDASQTAQLLADFAADGSRWRAAVAWERLDLN